MSLGDWDQHYCFWDRVHVVSTIRNGYFVYRTERYIGGYIIIKVLSWFILMRI